MDKCNLCPRECNVNRTNGEKGICSVTGSGIVGARAALHMWEEPCISGENGSGTVFFSGCPLRCVYCQNYYIANGTTGSEISKERLAEIFLELQEKNAENINLVTPTHYTPEIIWAVKRAREQGLHLPIVYNCSGYEKVETIQALDGLVDIYLPDLKYADNRLASALSGCGDYFQVATAAIKEMVAQVGPVQWDGDKVVRGVIIRHLILPGFVDNSLKVLDWIGETFVPGEVLVSLMRQYTPMPGLPAPLNRPITEEEYDSVLSWMFLNDLEGFTQEDSASDTAFIPDF